MIAVNSAGQSKSADFVSEVRHGSLSDSERGCCMFSGNLAIDKILDGFVPYFSFFGHPNTSQLDAAKDLWIFDEIHKYRLWKAWLKGLDDEFGEKYKFLVTGSARLDIFKKGGDSLQGRYFRHRLFPFTLAELLHPSSIPDLLNNNADSFFNFKSQQSYQKVFDDLMLLGGFPEPYSKGSKVFADRWRLLYQERLIREDIRDLTEIKNLDKLELVSDRLPSLVASVLSVNNLREDAEVSHDAVKNWLLALENLYSVFRISPMGAPKIKAVLKEQKLYCWDWARVENMGARFENLVALSLLKFVQAAQDLFGIKTELRYFRDTLGHEVDFVVFKKNQPWFAVECKLKNEKLDSNLSYLLNRVKIPYAFQLSCYGELDYETKESFQGTRIRVMPAAKFLAVLM